MFILQDYVARFGHGSAKLARQAQSKEKVMNKMVAGGLTEKVVHEKVRWTQLFPFMVFSFVPTLFVDETVLFFRTGWYSSSCYHGTACIVSIQPW